MGLRIAVLALLALGLTAYGDSGPEIPKSKLSRLVLAAEDVRPLTEFDVGPQVRLDNLVGPRKDPERFGREGGWKAGGPAPSPRRARSSSSRGRICLRPHRAPVATSTPARRSSGR